MTIGRYRLQRKKENKEVNKYRRDVSHEQKIENKKHIAS